LEEYCWERNGVLLPTGLGSFSLAMLEVLVESVQYFLFF